MATIQTSSTFHSLQENPHQINPQQLAVRLADSIVVRSYAPLAWSLYRQRFLDVLGAEALPQKL